jgi:hypothetical protein
MEEAVGDPDIAEQLISESVVRSFDDSLSELFRLAVDDLSQCKGLGGRVDQRSAHMSGKPVQHPHESSLMRESLSHRFWTNWQISKTQT